MEEFYQAWHFIQEHPKFFRYDEMSVFPYGLDIMVVKVDPDTTTIEDDETQNTEVRVWLEYGPWEKAPELDNQIVHTHDIRLDCGADTFENAIIELAKLIKRYYGDYEPQEEETQQNSNKKGA